MPKLLSVGELIDTSWDSYREDFMELVSISSWMLLVAFLDVISLALNPLASETFSGAALTGTETFGLALYLFTKFVAAPVIGLWVFLALVRFVAARMTGKRMDVRSAIKESRKLFWPSVLVSILLGLMLVGAIVIGVGPGLVVGLIATAVGSTVLGIVAVALSALGMLAAIILVIKWAIEYGMAVYALCIDGIRSRAALTYAKSLVSGRFLSTMVRVLIPNVVFVILGTVAVGIPAYFLSLVLFSASGINSDVQLRLYSVINAVFPIIAAVLLNPLLVIANVLLYKSLKETKTMRLAK